jgi:hypothetical protein
MALKLSGEKPAVSREGMMALYVSDLGIRLFGRPAPRGEWRRHSGLSAFQKL